MQKATKFKNYIKLNHYINNIGILSSFILLLLTLSILIPINLKGEKTIAASGDTSTTSLTLSTTSGSAELDLLVTSDSGTFASSATPLTFSASTNNYTGYTLSIKSATSNTALTNNYADGDNNSSSATFTSLSSTNATTKNGITATTFNSSTYNNQWGFKPSYYNSTANSDKFYPSPDSTGVTLNRTNCANGSSNGTYTCPNSSDSYTIAIGARATYAQVAGTYTNRYILSAVGNFPTYTVNYIDSLTGTTLSTTSADSTTLSPDITLSSAPTKDGYDFGGWCSVDNSTDPSACKDSSGTAGTTYNANTSHTLTLGTTTANVNNFYSIWTASKLYMWNATSADCGKNMWDNRDGVERVYTTASIVGLCWMTTNLALGASTTIALTPTTSNVPSTGYTLPASSTSGFNNYTDRNIYTTDSNTCDADSPCYGYYTYLVATANTTLSISDYDICPAGWRLPTTAELTALKNVYATGADLVASPFRAVYAGLYEASHQAYGGWIGFYWSSVYNGSNGGYMLSFNDDIANIDATGYAYRGIPIRCVAKS